MGDTVNRFDALEAKAHTLFPRMKNRAMARKLASGEAVDVRSLMRSAEWQAHVDGSNAMLYHLERYIDGVDYCDAQDERWIWSIGLCLLDGKVIASTDTRFYKNAEFDCLWLR